MGGGRRALLGGHAARHVLRGCEQQARARARRGWVAQGGRQPAGRCCSIGRLGPMQAARAPFCYLARISLCPAFFGATPAWMAAGCAACLAGARGRGECTNTAWGFRAVGWCVMCRPVGAGACLARHAVACVAPAGAAGRLARLHAPWACRAPPQFGLLCVREPTTTDCPAPRGALSIDGRAAAREELNQCAWIQVCCICWGCRGAWGSALGISRLTCSEARPRGF